MRAHTIVLDLNNDGSIRLTSGTLGGVLVGLRRGGVAERVMQVQPVYEDEIAQYVRGFRDCERMGAWHALDDACSVAAEAQDAAAEFCGALADALFKLCHPRRPVSDVTDLLDAIAGTASERASARVVLAHALEALDGLDAVCEQASRDDFGTAYGGDHQGPLIDGGEHVRH